MRWRPGWGPRSAGALSADCAVWLTLSAAPEFQRRPLTLEDVKDRRLLSNGVRLPVDSGTLRAVIRRVNSGVLEAEHLLHDAGPDVGLALKPKSSSALKPVMFWSNREPASLDTSMRIDRP